MGDSSAASAGNEEPSAVIVCTLFSGGTVGGWTGDVGGADASGLGEGTLVAGVGLGEVDSIADGGGETGASVEGADAATAKAGTSAALIKAFTFGTSSFLIWVQLFNCSSRR